MVLPVTSARTGQSPAVGRQPSASICLITSLTFIIKILHDDGAGFAHSSTEVPNLVGSLGVAVDSGT